MADPTVLRLSRPQHGPDEADFVLVQVIHQGRSPLDIKLIGTETSLVFSVSLKHKNVSRLRAKNATIPEDRWDGVLQNVLLGTSRHGNSNQMAVMDGVEAIARVENNAMVIIIQKRIEGITQKLGTISLPQEEDEIDIFAWCGLAINERDTSRQEREALETMINDKDEEISRLKQSYVELVKMKDEHETQFLEKFSLILNEKKLKIRDQQRVLATAAVDPAKVAAVEEIRMATRSRSPGPTRKGKRKATANAQDGDDESDGFEKMEVDEAVEKEDSDQEPTRTPDHSDEETQSEDDDLAEAASPVLHPLVKIAANKQKLEEEAPAASEENFKMPPKRALPFANKPPPQSPKPAPADEDSETESDDEL